MRSAPTILQRLKPDAKPPIKASIRPSAFQTHHSSAALCHQIRPDPAIRKAISYQRLRRVGSGSECLVSGGQTHGMAHRRAGIEKPGVTWRNGSMNAPVNVLSIGCFLTVAIFRILTASSAAADIAWVSDDVVNKARQALVSVDSKSLGGVNGFYVSADGLIMTNAAALEGMKTVNVVNDAQEVIRNVRLVALVPEHNLAVLATGRKTPAYLNIRKDVAAVREACVVVYHHGHRVAKEADGVLLGRVRSIDWTETRMQEQWSLGLAPGKIGLCGAPVVTADGCVAGICDIYSADIGGIHARTMAIPESALHKALTQARASQSGISWPKAGEIAGYVQPQTQIFADGMKLVSAGQFEKAIEKLEAALALDPDNTQIIWHLANACLVSGNIPDGEKWLRECIRLTPQKLMAQVQLGTVIKGKGDAVAAEKHFRNLLTREPELSQAWRALVKLLSGIGRNDEALAASKKWTDIQPDSIEAWQFHAMLLEATGDYAGSTKAGDKAFEIESLLFKVRYAAPKRK